MGRYLGDGVCADRHHVPYLGERTGESDVDDTPPHSTHRAVRRLLIN
ncbi:MAG: hypothetical protein ACLFRT_14140 [Actinomycetota bacterium]